MSHCWMLLCFVFFLFISTTGSLKHAIPFLPKITQIMIQLFVRSSNICYDVLLIYMKWYVRLHDAIMNEALIVCLFVAWRFVLSDIVCFLKMWGADGVTVVFVSPCVCICLRFGDILWHMWVNNDKTWKHLCRRLLVFT